MAPYHMLLIKPPCKFSHTEWVHKRPVDKLPKIIEAQESAMAPQQKRLFVTIGATAPFNGLIRAVLSHGFLSALSEHSYTQLRIQHGDQGGHILREASLSNIQQQYGIEVTGFDFDKNGLEGELRALKKSSTNEEGAVVSHAGSGSVLEAMRYELPIVVVPNEELLGNHQVELAEELGRLGYVVHGRVEDLAGSIIKVEQLRDKHLLWPPHTSGETRNKAVGKGLKGVLDEEMGWALRVE
ncbi:UDP-N-acetylglucosamine transferase subunit alg13 [Cyphellophora attinorum]|uniref:UDP-N-acetylglucosamine transferase subunit ALG13 n=1 Tax=Cyphellophora attinorum TaxID=1664694 RepID=A0A0N0NMR0_9EURO|nr:UDP-N-acetylglucosamine transferase subunit alg13 [Phialophora attinorum]KPI40499.1 UDP-N-acetylglucosamine transferase subunit alg13 [Phialophora attinorum]